VKKDSYFGDLGLFRRVAPFRVNSAWISKSRPGETGYAVLLDVPWTRTICGEFKESVIVYKL
jgi:hypothetical protein